MELLSKIATAVFFGVVVILTSAAVLILVITVEFKLIFARIKKANLELTKEEQRIFELSSLVTQSMNSVNSYISELASKRQALQDKKCHCLELPTNNAEDQIE